ncbi:MAG TPA: hypothetical protein VMF91_19505 [Bryobacteraceae bacterium]|nr:hypothetical protein [Bryobacteraceae bacterium]
MPAVTVIAIGAAGWLLGAHRERPGRFEVLGPGGGGAMFNPTISPHDSNTVLVSCDMTGSYITHDGGRHWRMFNLRGTVSFFAFDPANPQVLYAMATGLWRSTDGGETWRLMYPKPSFVHGIEMASDHAEERILAEPDPLGVITAFAVDPRDSRTLYAAGSNNSASRLFVSHDGGENWILQRQLAEPATHIWIHGSETIVGSAHRIQIYGRQRTQTLAVPNSARFTYLSPGFRDSAMTIYAVAGDSGYVSVSGSEWRRCELPGKGAKVRAIATSLNHPEVAYLSYGDLELNGKAWEGVAKTSDSGKTWTLVWQDGPTAASNIHDAWITQRFGADWGENPLMLGVAQQDPNLAYATDLGRTMKTSDGGATWNAVYSQKASASTWTSTGLDVTTSYGIHFDPFDRKREFITYTDIGLFRSEDGGRSWISSTAGVPREWTNTTYWVVFDPAVRGRMWSVNSGTHDLPRPKMWRRTSVATYRGGVCRSDDGGRTWIPSNTGMEETAPTHILLDANSSVNTRTLYVAAFGRGIYKSADDGKTWRLKNTGIRQSQPFAWRLAQDSAGKLYVLVARRSEHGEMGDDRDGAIYGSEDGAEHWTEMNLPAGVNGPNGVAIDPKDPKRIYLAAWARAVGTHGEGGGIFLSTDSGKTWTCVLDRDQHVYDVTIDARDPSVLYAAGFESSAWRSTDRGEHWVRIPGFNFKWGHRVIPDPSNREQVYVTTFGGSVWHGGVEGVARPLDILTPEMQPARLQ